MINDKKIVGSIVGPHAGESLDTIFKRKIKDIKKTGKTIWVVNSAQISPGILKNFCDDKTETYCYFLLSSSNKQGNPTKENKSVKFYSNDLKIWDKIDSNLSPITGKIDYTTTGIVIDKIDFIDDEIDFWDYIDYLDGIRSIITFRGGSTFCGIKSNIKIKASKSNIRTIVAKARLCKPFGIFLMKK